MVCSAILAVSRAFIPSKASVFNPSAAFTAVLKHTHYYPPHWHGRTHHTAVRDEFAALFQTRAVVFVQEVLGVLTAPFVLMFVLPVGWSCVVVLCCVVLL